MLMHYNYCSKMRFIKYLIILQFICTWVWGTKYALTGREKQRHTPLHPTPLPSSSPLPSPLPHSSAFPTFGQKKRLENEPESKGPGRSKLSRRGPGEGPGRTRNQREESQGEGARENKELEPERTRARQRARQKQRNGCKLRVEGCVWCRV